MPRATATWLTFSRSALRSCCSLKSLRRAGRRCVAQDQTGTIESSCLPKLTDEGEVIAGGIDARPALLPPSHRDDPLGAVLLVELDTLDHALLVGTKSAAAIPRRSHGPLPFIVAYLARIFTSE